MPSIAELHRVYHEVKESYFAKKKECLEFVQFLFENMASYLEGQQDQDIELIRDEQFDGAYWGYLVRINLPENRAVSCVLAARTSGDYYSVKVTCGSHSGDFPVPRNRPGSRPIEPRMQSRKAEPVYDLLSDIVARVIREDAHHILEGGEMQPRVPPSTV